MFQCQHLLRNCRYAPRLMKAGTPDGSELKYLNASILFLTTFRQCLFSSEIQWWEAIWSAVQTQQITASLCWQGLQMTHHASGRDGGGHVSYLRLYMLCCDHFWIPEMCDSSSLHYFSRAAPGSPHCCEGIPPELHLQAPHVSSLQSWTSAIHSTCIHPFPERKAKIWMMKSLQSTTLFTSCITTVHIMVVAGYWSYYESQ